MSGLLSGYMVINIILGTALYILRDSIPIAIALILSMAASGVVVLVRLSSIASKVEKNIEVINKGQLNKNVKKT
ncbi:MAG TPA: hypothetical protein PLL98_08945, partial [Bacillota bacterium]|nr:hypothetical protein [Bacillota bacterium]